jgi:DNA-binding NtrC family response regulator
MQKQLSGHGRTGSRIDCVVLTSFDNEFSFLNSVLRPAGIRIHRAETLEQADFLLMVTETTVLLSDVAAVDCSWRCAMERFREYHPLVAMLLIADPIDEPYVQDAFQLGACGVLWKPIQFDTATRLIRVANEASRERAVLKAELMQPRLGGAAGLFAAGAGMGRG